ncbi:hypothetical protein HDU67_009723 [Dinochytrium kinnereticum]|nr:hypothetical protein HDU67_009723 [Dinochytrium kinnereticum]
MTKTIGASHLLLLAAAARAVGVLALTEDSFFENSGVSRTEPFDALNEWGAHFEQTEASRVVDRNQAPLIASVTGEAQSYSACSQLRIQGMSQCDVFPQSSPSQSDPVRYQCMDANIKIFDDCIKFVDATAGFEAFNYTFTFPSSASAKTTQLNGHTTAENLSPLLSTSGDAWTSGLTFRRCGAVSRVESKVEQMISDQIEQWDMNPPTLTQTDIDVYFHIYRSSNGTGDLTRDSIDKQMRLLNKAFERSQLRFNVVRITRISNDTVFNYAGEGKAGEEEYPLFDQIFKRRRKGGPGELNILTAKLPTLLGYAQSPWDYEKYGSTDGVVLAYTTFPGVLQKGEYNLGHTLIHEVGHWGLLVNQGGDFVSDTPASASANSGCKRGTDSCPGRVGKDPIHNYMDYTDDVCMSHFTRGQFRRVLACMKLFRNSTALP